MFCHLDDQDLGALIPYLRTLPERAGEPLPSNSMRLLARVGLTMGAVQGRAARHHAEGPRYHPGHCGARPAVAPPPYSSWRPGPCMPVRIAPRGAATEHVMGRAVAPTLRVGTPFSNMRTRCMQHRGRLVTAWSIYTHAVPSRGLKRWNRARYQIRNHHRGGNVYIDGSAGSLILQMLAAGLFALGATLRVVRESVKRFFQGRFGQRNREQ